MKPELVSRDQLSQQVIGSAPRTKCSDRNLDSVVNDGFKGPAKLDMAWDRALAVPAVMGIGVAHQFNDPVKRVIHFGRDRQV